MRIVHFTLGSVDPDSLNGINRVIEGLAHTMNAGGMAEVSVITVRKKMTSPGRQVFKRDGFTVTACRSTDEALKLFDETLETIDLVHLHNAWSRVIARVGSWLVQNRIPYVLTPHAAFLPDRMTRKTWRKSLFHRFVQQKLVDEASALIAVSRDEMASIAQFTSNPRIEFVQNGAQDIDWQSNRAQRKSGGPVTLGYLGRIGREKNILALIQAVHLLPPNIRSQLRIHIYGNQNTAYGLECQKLARDLGVSEIVAFRGVVSAAEKWAALGALDAYVQPSLSEAASIAVLEAIAMGLPMVATRTSGVSYWHGQPFLTMVEPVASELARGLEAMLRDRSTLQERGTQARAFFEDNFVWPVVASRQLDVYRNCLGDAHRSGN